MKTAATFSARIVREAKSEVAKVRQSLDLSQETFADLLGIGLNHNHASFSTGLS